MPGMTRRLRHGSGTCSPMGRSFSSGGPKGAVNGKPTARLRAHNHAEGLTRRLRRELGLAVPWGAHTFLSVAKEKCAKESQRHGDSRGGPPRCALFANIGVPGTAVPGSCICSGLSVANCLRQLCPLGTRSLSAQASVCGSPFGAVLEHGVSGVAQLPTGRSARLPPSLRVALGCAQGPTGATLPFGTVRCAHPPGKRLLLPILTAGLAMSRAMEWASLPIRAGRARARLFPPTK